MDCHEQTLDNLYDDILHDDNNLDKLDLDQNSLDSTIICPTFYDSWIEPEPSKVDNHQRTEHSPTEVLPEPQVEPSHTPVPQPSIGSTISPILPPSPTPHFKESKDSKDRVRDRERVQRSREDNRDRIYQANRSLATKEYTGNKHRKSGNPRLFHTRNHHYHHYQSIRYRPTQHREPSADLSPTRLLAMFKAQNGLTDTAERWILPLLTSACLLKEHRLKLYKDLLDFLWRNTHWKAARTSG